MEKQQKQELKQSRKLEREKLRIKKLEEKSINKAKGFLTEFKQFATKGNVIDMAVGVIIANSFTKIVNSLVNDVINPVVGWLIGNKNFSDLAIELVPDDPATEAVVETVAVKYGQFIQNIVDFLIIAFVVFCLVKVMNKVRSQAEKLNKKED